MASGQVHYKFKSALTSSAISFDGAFIPVADLKRAIVERSGLMEGSDCDLRITNAQTQEGEHCFAEGGPRECWKRGVTRGEGKGGGGSITSRSGRI